MLLSRMPPNPKKRIEKMLPKGWHAERGGRGKHFRIYRDNGEILRAPNGVPVTVSCSAKPRSNWEKQFQRDLDKATREINE
jgi:hypothetical protein